MSKRVIFTPPPQSSRTGNAHCPVAATASRTSQTSKPVHPAVVEALTLAMKIAVFVTSTGLIQ